MKLDKATRERLRAIYAAQGSPAQAAILEIAERCAAAVEARQAWLNGSAGVYELGRAMELAETKALSTLREAGWE